jgi:aminoglycoside phosphotransferase (APT) family kinase protein
MGALGKGLEPAAAEMLAQLHQVEPLSAVHGRAVDLSAAISLKRVADALDRIEDAARLFAKWRREHWTP